MKEHRNNFVALCPVCGKEIGVLGYNGKVKYAKKGCARRGNLLYCSVKCAEKDLEL